MKKNIKTLGFIILLLSIVASFAIPIMQILKYEDVIKNGASLKFKLNGFDPFDLFRGRFVQISLNINEIKFDEPIDRDEFFKNFNSKHGRYRPSDGYLYFEQGEDGYAKLVDFSTTKLDNNKVVASGKFSPYNVECQEIDNKTIYQNIVSYSPELKLDRFYMNEYIAIEAEKLLSEDEVRDRCYIIVKVKNNIPVIENIYVKSNKKNEKDLTIREYINNKAI